MAVSPVVLPCPDGYGVAVRDDGTSVCEPWAAERPSCGDDELLVPGVGCEAISACEVQTLMAGQSLVSAGAPPGGDGTLERPYATVYEAWSDGASDVLLSDGSHALGRAVSGITIEGRCPAMTEIVLGGAVYLSDVTLRGVRITGPVGTNLAVRAGATLTLEEVRMTGLDRAIEIEGTLIARRSSVRDGGVGLLAFDATAVELDHVFFEGLTELALYADRTEGRPGTTVTLRDVVVIDGGDDPVSGQIQLDVGTLTAARVVIEDCTGLGMNVRSDTASVSDLTARRTTAQGLSLLVGAAEVNRVYAVETGGGVFFADGEITARSIVIERSLDLGITVENATLDGADISVHDAVSAGISLGGSRATLRNVSVSEVAPLADRMGTGAGILVERGSDLTIERAAIRDVHTYGLGAYAARITASDVVIRGVRGEGDAGYGVIGVVGSTLALTRIDVADVDTIGFSVEDSTAEVSDLRVEGVRAIDGANGLGIMVSGVDTSASLVLDRAVVIDTVRWGVLASGPASATLTRIHVTSVSESPCADLNCPETSGGAAFIAHDGASLTVTDFRASSAAYAGVIATAGVHAVLTRGVIERNAVGLVVSPSLSINLGASPGLDLMEVTLLDNGVEQQSTEISVEPPRFEPR
jgi:hypothetical protein